MHKHRGQKPPGAQKSRVSNTMLTATITEAKPLPDSDTAREQQGAHTGVEAARGELIAGGRAELDLLAIRAHQRVHLRVERQVARDRKRGHQLR